MPSVRKWLASLGLSEYADRFGIDFSILQDLTDKDLKEELGIVPLGDRRTLLRAIAKLAGAASTTPKLAPGSESSPRDEAERRQVTVMFADLVGSTALATAMDEDLREVISAYQKCVAETVHHFGGFVARYVGDGVLVFSAPLSPAAKIPFPAAGLEDKPPLRATHQAPQFEEEHHDQYPAHRLVAFRGGSSSIG